MVLGWLGGEWYEEGLEEQEEEEAGHLSSILHCLGLASHKQRVVVGKGGIGQLATGYASSR